MPDPTDSPSQFASNDQERSALFASLVVQQANLALMFLGEAPLPEGKEPQVDLDSASMFIDTLDMLEAKTRGNLDKSEAEFLRHTLTSLHMHFAKAVQARPAPTPPADTATAGPAPAAASAPSVAPAEPAPAEPPPAPDSESSESRKRFTKKY